MSCVKTSSFSPKILRGLKTKIFPQGTKDHVGLSLGLKTCSFILSFRKVSHEFKHVIFDRNAKFHLGIHNVSYSNMSSQDLLTSEHLHQAMHYFLCSRKSLMLRLQRETYAPNDIALNYIISILPLGPCINVVGTRAFVL